ncbi:MAG: hypothetical protein C4581_03565 [Nitrospiraceae bacterium]|nr:MAG: hypothetical protein C4581_03565 [Nitrospiraceae bacterium]
MKEAGNTGSLSTGARTVLGVICVLAVLLLIAGAATIPFFYESQSIRYKLGMDKTFLRAGKILAMAAGTLLLLQLLLSGKMKALERVFSSKQLYLTHRINAAVITALVIMHPLLVFAPEDIMNIPPDIRLWPEMLGAVLLVSICMLMSTAFFRNFLGFSFRGWQRLHHAGSVCVVIMLFVHVLFVSDTFESGPPRALVISVGTIYGILLLWVKVKPVLQKMRG